MYVHRGMTGVTANLYVGLDEFEDMALVLHFLRPGDLFVDVGANVGAYTILAAGAIGANVVAFEPGRTAREWLVLNVALNQCEDRVEVRHQAVGSFSGTSGFTKGLDTVNHLIPQASSLECDSDTELIEITTVDTVLERRSPVMLKVDVEGFETEVIRGASTTLANRALKCVLLELCGTGAAYGYDEKHIPDRMKQLGFEMCSYDPFERRLMRCDVLAAARNNALFVRDVPYVVERLASANTFSILNKFI